MSDDRNPDSGKPPQPADDSGPDSAGDDSLEALMRDAEALAHELGDQVGGASPKVDAGTPPTPDPEAHVEHVQENLDQATAEIGTEPSHKSTPLEVPPPDHSTESMMDGVDPSEWQTDDGDVPTIEGGDEEGSAATAPPAKKEKPSASTDTALATGTPKQRRLGWLRARVNVVRWAAISPKNLLRSVRRLPETAKGRPLNALRSMLATIDRLFGWVPLAARSFIGYAAVLTLVSSLVTFAVGWSR